MKYKRGRPPLDHNQPELLRAIVDISTRQTTAQKTGCPWNIKCVGRGSRMLRFRH